MYNASQCLPFSFIVEVEKLGATYGLHDPGLEINDGSKIPTINADES